MGPTYCLTVYDTEVSEPHELEKRNAPFEMRLSLNRGHENVRFTVLFWRQKGVQKIEVCTHE